MECVRTLQRWTNYEKYSIEGQTTDKQVWMTETSPNSSW